MSHAFHSPQMASVLEPFAAALAQVALEAPRVGLWSALTGRPEVEAWRDRDAWCRQIREPVRFAEAMASLSDHGHRRFLEIGPAPVLSILGSRTADGEFSAPLAPDTDPVEGLVAALGELYVGGTVPDFSALYGGPRRRVGLPAYPWQRTRHWIDHPHDAQPPALRTVTWAPAPTTPPPPRVTVFEVPGAQAVAEAFAGSDTVARIAPPAAGVPAIYVAPPTDPADIDLSGVLEAIAACSDAQAPLWIVTEGAHRAEDPSAIGHGALWGLARVVAVEHPAAWGGLVDLDQSDYSVLTQIVGRTGGDDAFVVADGGILVPRWTDLDRDPAGRGSRRNRPDHRRLRRPRAADRQLAGGSRSRSHRPRRPFRCRRPRSDRGVAPARRRGDRSGRRCVPARRGPGPDRPGGDP